MNKWKVIYYISQNGDNPVSDFLDTLTSTSQTKILRIVKNIEEYGLQSVIPHIKKLPGTPFWEIRVLGKNSIRVIYIVPVQLEVFLLHGFQKKTQKTAIKDLTIASRRYREYISRKKSS